MHTLTCDGAVVRVLPHISDRNGASQVQRLQRHSSVTSAHLVAVDHQHCHRTVRLRFSPHLHFVRMQAWLRMSVCARTQTLSAWSAHYQQSASNSVVRSKRPPLHGRTDAQIDTQVDACTAVQMGGCTDAQTDAQADAQADARMHNTPLTHPRTLSGDNPTATSTSGQAAAQTVPSRPQTQPPRLGS